MAYTDADKVDIVFQNTQELDSDERDHIVDIEKEFVRPEINGRLADEYDVPFKSLPDTPALITTIATWLTAYYFVVFPGSGGSDQFEYVRELRDNATDMLSQLENGDSTLQELQDSSSFDFDRVKSDSFYDQAVFVGSLDNPNDFGDFDKSIEDPDTITD